MNKSKLKKRMSEIAKIGVEKRHKRLSPAERKNYYIGLQAKRKVRRGRFSK